MSNPFRQLSARLRSISLIAITMIFALGAFVVFAAISLSTSTPATQNFDGIGTSATATLPADFRVDNPATVRTVGTFAAAVTATTLAGGANLSSTAGNGIYNFGSGTTATGPDRAVGFLSSGTATASGNLYAQFANTTGASLSGLQISYSVEKYRGGSNLAGFRIELFYSTDGSNWTSAGGSFVTTFAADASNAGFATAPGATVAISNQPLTVAVPNGGNVYLAWNYSVASGNTRTNAQALAIDDISVTGIGAGDDAPSVATTTPTTSATNVPVNSSIVINFSESVTATASAFSIQCPTGSPQTFSQSASPASSFTLTPTSALPHSTTCTVTVTAAEVTDTDANDPPDQMASNYSFSFTTASPVDDAPTVTATTPANGASGVSVNSSIVINFSESISATASAFSLQCPLGTPKTFTQTGSPSTSFTLMPTSPLPHGTTCSVTVTGTEITDADANDPPNEMASNFSFSFTTAQPVATNIIINEVDSDTPGVDAAEFVELFDGGVGNTPLDGLVLVFFNGSNTLSYASFDLDGFTTDANGYFTLGNAALGPDVVFAGNLLQNGADAVALYAGNATDFPTSTPVTTANLQDAVVYDTDDADIPGLLVLLNAGEPQVNENGGGDGAAHSSQRCANGAGGARNTSTYVQGAPSPDGANTCPVPPTPSNSPVVISQIYGGGGNGGAAYQNDFVELFNRSAALVDITGWSLQYASKDGSGWDFSKQPLGGTIGPGEYLLISLASGGSDGAALPPANITGQINMSGTDGKVALVNSFDGLVGNCPLADLHLMDLVGYGSADCHEGTTAAPAASNTTSLFRLGNGATDTDRNGNDFVTGSPSPRRTAPIVELGPVVLTSDPRANGFNAPRDATISVTFTEPVDVTGAWFNIACATTGSHNSATVAGSGQNHFITPNVDFAPGEQCTITLFKDQIHDQDLDDSGPNTDTLPADYVWTFTVASGTAPPHPASQHLLMGNPSGATPSVSQPANFLMEKPEYALSYNRDFGRPNWVSWHLSDEWVGTLTRFDTFRADPRVPEDWYRVQGFDFTGSGFDRGHMVPNADRDKETSIPINQATFLMTNMLAQAPDNNQGPWAAFENYLRTLTPAEEIYIVAGGVGTGGTGGNGSVTTTIAGGHVNVPAYTWKVALVIPKDSGDDIPRVSCSSRTIAVVMPNTQGIRNDPWENFLTTVDAVETLTGYDLFSNLPLAIQACVEAGLNGNNPPLDTVAPSVTCASPDGAWHAGNVMLSCTASDGGSGLAHSADASFLLVTSVADGTEDGNASTNSRVVCDVAGNCTTAVISGNKIDRLAPAITLTTPANGAIYQLNQVVNAAYGCPDGGSGLGSCIGTVGNLSPVDTTSLGSKTFVVNATDAVGNTSSTTVNYEVRRTLSAVGPFKVWLGLKNSDDVGLRVDLKTELLIDTSVVSTGDLLNVPTGSSGFNNAILQSVAMSLAPGSVEVPPGTPLSVRVSVRRTCSGGGHNSGRVRQWFNGAPIDSGATRDAGSRIQLTLGGVTADYFLRSAFGLSTTSGASRDSVELTVNSSAPCGTRPYSVLGVWSIGSQ